MFDKQPKVRVDGRCDVTIVVTLDRPRDDVWHEYLADVGGAVNFLDVASSADIVMLTVNEGLVDFGLEQPHGVRRALDWLVTVIPQVDRRRQEQENHQRNMQKAADEHLAQWWGDYLRSIG